MTTKQIKAYFKHNHNTSISDSDCVCLELMRNPNLINMINSVSFGNPSVTIEKEKLSDIIFDIYIEETINY